MITENLIATVLVDYLQSVAYAHDSIRNETDLLETGLLDSLQVMDLVCFLEARFQVTMQPADINPNNLRSVSRIAHFVHARAA